MVIAPGAASSSGDIKGASEFMKESPLIVIFGGAAAVFVMLASDVNGFLLSEYGRTIVINAFGAFMAMLLLSWLTLYAIVNSHRLRAYLWAAAAFIIGLGIAKFGLAIPSIAAFTASQQVLAIPFASSLFIFVFSYPLIIGLLAADATLFLIGLKRK